jgi:hypothetical protein
MVLVFVTLRGNDPFNLFEKQSMKKQTKPINA